jgi:hypothetical protein
MAQKARFLTCRWVLFVLLLLLLLLLLLQGAQPADAAR